MSGGPIIAGMGQGIAQLAERFLQDVQSRIWGGIEFPTGDQIDTGWDGGQQGGNVTGHVNPTVVTSGQGSIGDTSQGNTAPIVPPGQFPGGSVGVPGGQGSVPSTGGIGSPSPGGTGSGGGSGGGSGTGTGTGQPTPPINTGNEWVDWVLQMLAMQGINVASQWVINEVFEAFNGSPGEQLRRFMQDAYPGTVPWEWLGNNSGAGFSAQQGGRTAREGLYNQLKIAQIQYRGATDSSTITSGPGHRQATVSEAKQQPEIDHIRADTFKKNSKVELLGAQVENTELRNVLEAARARIATNYVNSEVYQMVGDNLFTMLINSASAIEGAARQGGEALKDAGKTAINEIRGLDIPQQEKSWLSETIKRMMQLNSGWQTGYQRQ